MIIYKTINHTVERRHNVANGSDYTLPARSSASIILVTEGQGDQVKVVFLFLILHKKIPWQHRIIVKLQQYFCLKESEGNKCSVSPGSVLFIPANAISKVTCSQVDQQHTNNQMVDSLELQNIFSRGQKRDWSSSRLMPASSFSQFHLCLNLIINPCTLNL